MLRMRWSRIMVVCAASLAGLWLTPSDGPVEPSVVGFAILALGLASYAKPVPVKRRHPQSADLERRIHSGEPDERVSGIHALEAVANENPAHRQEIVNILCDYLREKGGLADHLEARRVAQDMLISHLRTVPGQGDGGPEFWSDMNIDLSGAILYDWNMSRCHFGKAQFREVQFDGLAAFSGARFDGWAMFVGAHFSDKATFKDIEFNDESTFQKARFCSDATFSGARFETWSWFSSICFDGKAVFDNARFKRRTSFDRTTFGVASFNGTSFNEAVTFDGAQINGVAFDRETVLKRARFDS